MSPVVDGFSVLYWLRRYCYTPSRCDRIPSRLCKWSRQPYYNHTDHCSRLFFLPLQLFAAGLVLLIYVVVLKWMKNNAIQQQQARPVTANADDNVLGIAAANAADQEGTQQNIQASTTDQDTRGSMPQRKGVRTTDAPEARKEDDTQAAAALGQQAEETRRLTARTGIQAGDAPSPQGAGVILLENQAESGASPCQGLQGNREEEAPTKHLIPEEQFEVDLVGETEQEDQAELSLEGVKRDLAQDKVGSV